MSRHLALSALIALGTAAMAVASFVGGVDGEVARVRALRAADRRLTLADAVALVRGSRG